MAREPMRRGLVLAGGFAGWSLLLAVAAWAGLGSRLGDAGLDSEAAPVPAVPVLPEDRVQALVAYPQTAARPLFNDNRRPQPYYIGGDAPAAGAGMRLTGVMLTPQANVAILSGEGGLSLRLPLGGAPVQGWQLLELSPRQATVLGPSGTQVLLLATYDGGTTPATDAPQPAPSGTVNERSDAASRAAPAVLPVPPPAAAAAAPAASSAEPSAAQMQAIRERIQARRQQMQQNNNGQNPGQNR